MDYVGGLCSIMALVIGYFALNRENREDLKSAVRSMLSHIKRSSRILGYILAVGLALTGTAGIATESFFNIMEFLDAETPITRPEIIKLLVNAFNFVMYAIYFIAGSIILIAYVQNKAKQKAVPETALTREPPASGNSENRP
ncbi:hypothetical protein [Pseudomonas aeruginosa]|uniref:hypothetical protein n=1 Tax=Pseudomonas aeruginosa TaxID=287 RepID=UPI002954D70C|nr:hypothetical protein [Pseudomonas aeruginosa]MDV7944272.1 hypothetical protein [Pseudomonas aeruginosa]